MSNNTLSRAELSNAGKIKNIHYGDVLIKFGEVTDASSASIPFIGSETALKKNTDYLQTGDVIIADTAEDDTVGKATEIQNANCFPVVSGLHTIPCRPNLSFSPSYLGYFLNSKPFHEQLYPFMQGIKVTSISKGNLGKTLIKYPEPNEQRKISELLNLITKRIEKQRQLLEALKSYKRGALSKLFPQKGETMPQCRFAKFTEPWEQRKLGEIAGFSKGAGYSKSDIQEAGTPLILYGRLYTKYELVISHVDTFAIVKHGSIFSKGGEVIIPASGETAEDISIAAVVENPGIMLGGDLNIVTPSSSLYAPFLALTISYGRVHDDLSKRAQGKSVVHLHNDDLRTIDVFLPSIDEQQTIGSFFRQIEHLITFHQRKLEKYMEVKSGLLQQLFI